MKRITYFVTTRHQKEEKVTYYKKKCIYHHWVGIKHASEQ